MENRNILQKLAQYRVKIERDGKSVADVPGIICLPGLLAAPRLSIAGMIAAPLLGYSMHLENEEGNAVNIENAIQKTAETVVETAASTARTVKEEIDKAWQALSADDPESDESKENVKSEEDISTQEVESNQVIVEDLEKHEVEDIPTIHVNPDDSAQE